MKDAAGNDDADDRDQRSDHGSREAAGLHRVGELSAMSTVRVSSLQSHLLRTFVDVTPG
jgi:hypothetical protein